MFKNLTEKYKRNILIVQVWQVKEGNNACVASTIISIKRTMLKFFIFLVPLSLLARMWLNLAEGQFFIPSIKEETLITIKTKTVILALISIIIILPFLAEMIPHQYRHHVIHIHHSYKVLSQVRYL